MRTIVARTGHARLLRLMGALLPGLTAGSIGAFLLIQGSRHPDRFLRGVFWGAVIFFVFLIWEQLVAPRLSGRRLTMREKAAKFFACSIAGFLGGFCYGASLTPLNPDPGNTLGGTVFGFTGLFLGACLGWPWREPTESEGSDIGFEK